VEALGNFSDEVTAQCLLRLVEEDGPSSGVAAHALARRHDARPVPFLLQKLVSKVPRDQHTGNIAGRYIAEFERAGYLALEPLLGHEDREIRSRVITGIFDMACA